MFVIDTEPFVKLIRIMSVTRHDIDQRSAATRGASGALFWGALGVIAFSLSLPATRLAVMDLDGTIVGLGRAVVAALLAGIVLAVSRQPLPPPRLWPRLGLVGLGVVLGFPLFSSLALTLVPVAHAAVIAGLLPAATAVMAVLRAREQPSPAFWLATAAGFVAVLVFAAAQGAGRPQGADLLVLLAVVLGGLGYAEGAMLARELGGWQVISWALVLSAPILLPFLLLAVWRHGLSAGPAAWLGFAYVSLFAMYLGFFAWYRALAEGGVARVSQLQLAQPILTLLWSAVLLGEAVSWHMGAAAVAVLLSVVLTQRTRIHHRTL